VAVCESCAGEEDDDQLAPVWSTDGDSGDSPQLWCPACRDRYNHEPADDTD
jgi:hypothetical protein